MRRKNLLKNSVRIVLFISAVFISFHENEIVTNTTFGGNRNVLEECCTYCLFRTTHNTIQSQSCSCNDLLLWPHSQDCMHSKHLQCAGWCHCLYNRAQISCTNSYNSQHMWNKTSLYLCILTNYIVVTAGQVQTNISPVVGRLCLFQIPHMWFKPSGLRHR